MSDQNDEPKTAAEAVQRALRNDALFRQHYTQNTHEGDKRPGADEVRSNHAHAMRIVEHIFQTWDQDPNRVQARTQAATSAHERSAIETEIAKWRRNPAYMDRKHRDHDSVMSQVTSLYQKLNHPE